MVVPIEEIHKEIQNMGYVTATPQRTPIPSFYKLGDGTILSVLTKINHLLQNPFDPNSVALNSNIDIHVFVAHEKRNPRGKQLDSSQNIASSIIDEDIDCETLREEFNVYNLSNSSILSLKTVVGQVRKTDLYNQEGEPIYNINSQPVIKFKKK